MKVITNNQFKAMRKALLEYLDTRTDVYDYLFKSINGREVGEKRTPIWGGNKRPYLRMAQIKALWDDEDLYVKVAKLMIMVHYNGCVVYIGEGQGINVSDSWLYSYANTIWQKYKNSEKIIDADVA